MQSVMSVELKRDCEATQIPSGLPSILAAGTQVDITQTLGGSYTVHAMAGGLFRIGEKDCDALGLEKPASPKTGDKPAATGPVNAEAVWHVLKECYDPEIPVNIVDLGLVYDMKVNQLPSGGSSVSVRMTLTAPGCGMGGAIAGDAQQKLLSLAGVEEADVQIVWEPAWHPTLISEEGRRVLGLD
jgi:probable FeS assembly SUF system protein SufT